MPEAGRRDTIVRCAIPSDDPLFLRYHDEEWGHPVADDDRLYEKVCLEGFQSGLSWQTILHKRDAFREAFDGFAIDAVASFDERRVEQLMDDARIVRNRRKIESAIHNARRAQALRREFGSLGRFFWQFEPPASERPPRITAAWLKANPITPASRRLAGALKARQWRFVGPTTAYALMQALGLVNDHIESCDFRERVERARRTFAASRSGCGT